MCRALCVMAAALAWTAATVACAGKHAATAIPSPPVLVVGEFVDDYGSRYTITAREWFHQPAIRYRVVKWNLDEQYLIAQNAPSNTRSPNEWTRIDWMPLPDMAPYEWGFCLSSYDAPSAASAESSDVARSDRPKTGCNGFPFSRMRRVPAANPG